MGVRAQTASALPTGVVTFLLTDVEDSTRLWQAAPEAMGRAIDRHYELLGEAIERHGGVRPVEQGEGDSVVGAFARASDALAAALDAQLALRAELWAVGAELRVRMALHSGEARLRGESNYVGSAIIRCARLRALCPGGQIVLSGAVRELVRDALPAGTTLVNLGEQWLKGIERPERVYALLHPEFGERWELPSPPNNLPSALTPFVGRKRELREIATAMEGARLVTLTGPGGAGKTRLARQLAADCVESFLAGVWWVELAPLRDGDSAVEALSGALGVRPLPGRTPLQAVIGRLAEDRALVVLDNCEHLITAAADLSEALIRGCPHVVVLATSRERLGVPGEAEWLVPSLSLPAKSELETPEMVAGSDAGSLFVERAGKVRPDFALREENAASVARICHELDGIPLAIELAAARVRMMSVEQIAAELGDRFRLLTGGPRGAAPRQQTLRASVDWSYGLLSDDERVLFRRLAVFIGGWSLEAVESVCSGDGLDDWLILDLLASLVDKSLVVVEGHDRAARYRMLETVRQYALELLEAGGERPLMADRHLDFFADLAERGAVELDLPRNHAWLDVLDAEAANLESAIDRALAIDPERALQMCVALAAWWEGSGRFPTAHASLERALRAADPSPRPLRARGLWNCAQFARYRRDPGANELYEQAHEMAESVGDELTLARSLRTRGNMRMLQKPADGRSDLARAFELARSAGDAWAMIWSTTSLAWSYIFTDDYAEAERVLGDARPAIEQAGVQGFSWAGVPLGWCAMVRAAYERCFEVLEGSLSAARELGDPVAEQFAHWVWARVETMRGRADAALERLLESEARGIAAGAAMALPLTRLGQARAYAALSRLEQAETLLRAVIADTPQARWEECEALLALGNVRRILGAPSGSLACAREALELSERLGMRSLSADGHELLAMLAIGRGEWSEADGLAHDALARRVEIGAPIWLPQTLDLMALVAAGLESYTEAARLLGAAERARSDLGVVRWPPDEPAFEELERTIVGQLGTEEYAAARGQGAAVALDDAVGWARRARGTRKRPSGGWESLTPTELQVVQLVTQGLTNPQVAERMFISRATVKAHLSHIFQKLGLTSRSELAAVAARRAE